MSKGKTIFVLIIVALIILLGYVKYKNIQKAKLKQSSQGPGKGGPPPMVRSTGYVVEYSKLSNDLSANGTIVSGDDVQVQTEVAGRITYLNIKEGSYVGKGTVLARLNDAELQA